MKLEDITFDSSRPAIYRDKDYNLVPPRDRKARYAGQYRRIDGEYTHIVFDLDTGKPKIDDGIITWDTLECSLGPVPADVVWSRG